MTNRQSAVEDVEATARVTVNQLVSSETMHTQCPRRNCTVSVGYRATLNAKPDVSYPNV